MEKSKVDVVCEAIFNDLISNAFYVNSEKEYCAISFDNKEITEKEIQNAIKIYESAWPRNGLGYPSIKYIIFGDFMEPERKTRLSNALREKCTFGYETSVTLGKTTLKFDNPHVDGDLVTYSNFAVKRFWKSPIMSGICKDELCQWWRYHSEV